MSKNETNYLEENLRLDCTIRHMRNFQEGYREGMLYLIHGDKILDELNIDTCRFSPDGPSDVSYKEGWKKAEEDYNLK